MLFQREFPLLALQAFALVRKVGRPDRRSIGIVDVFENPYVYSDALLGILGGFGRFSVHLDTERGEPLARRFFLDRDLLHGSVVGDGAVEPNRYVREFRE